MSFLNLGKASSSEVHAFSRFSDAIISAQICILELNASAGYEKRQESARLSHAPIHCNL
jgi:hypothetical protein